MRVPRRSAVSSVPDSQLRYCAGTVPFRPGYCRKVVYDQGSVLDRQCAKTIWKDGWCKVHHPDSVKKREEKLFGKRERAAQRAKLSYQISALRETLAVMGRGLDADARRQIDQKVTALRERQRSI